jgi:hypothetical protein
LDVLELGEYGQGIVDHLFLGLFRFVLRVIRDENITVQIDSVHALFAPKRTTFFCLNVLTALKETVLPDFVLNLTVAGFLTVLTATNLTLFFAIKIMISPVKPLSAFRWLVPHVCRS